MSCHPGKLIWRSLNGRRWRSLHWEGQDQSGREYAPAGLDGEALPENPWPYAGMFYCNTFMDTPTSRWYRLEAIRPGDNEHGPWFAWERCDPPKGYVGAPAVEELLESHSPLPHYQDEDADTEPGVTI